MGADERVDTGGGALCLGHLETPGGCSATSSIEDGLCGECRRKFAVQFKTGLAYCRTALQLVTVASGAGCWIGSYDKGKVPDGEFDPTLRMKGLFEDADVMRCFGMAASDGTELAGAERTSRVLARFREIQVCDSQ